MKLLIDVNLSPKWVEVLTEAGWEAVHWASIGSGNSPDTSIMSFASTNGFAILTNDLDFGNVLAATNAAMPSVVQLRVEDVRPHIAGNFVISVLRDLADDLNCGVLVTLRMDRFRVALLPLRR